MGTEGVDGGALLDELRAVLRCEVWLDTVGRVQVKFPPEKPRDIWARLFIRAHLRELRAALFNELRPPLDGANEAPSISP